MSRKSAVSRQFIARIVLLAFALTLIGNAPVRANENLLGTLATVAGIAVVAAIVSAELDDDDDDDDDKKRRTRHGDHYGAQGHRAQASRFASDKSIVRPRPLPRRADRAFLPAECLRHSDGRNGSWPVFGKYCLERNYGFTRSLPDDCKVKFRVKGQKYKGYGARCLRRAGYRVALR